jgi:MFS superfamily sulfate permease-like transporter
MAISAFKMISILPFISFKDCSLMAIFAILFILVSRRYPLIPSALILTLIGLAISVMVFFQSSTTQFTFTLSLPIVIMKSVKWEDIWNGFWKAGLAQLPLTTLNSVVTVCDLNNNHLFPETPSYYLSQREVAMSVGLMNSVFLWFGGMPNCHGAGGLSAQYQFRFIQN